VAGAEDVIGPDSNKLTSLPSIPPEVMRTASERHQKGLMSPYIYQILTQVGILFYMELKERQKLSFVKKKFQMCCLKLISKACRASQNLHAGPQKYYFTVLTT